MAGRDLQWWERIMPMMMDMYMQRQRLKAYKEREEMRAKREETLLNREQRLRAMMQGFRPESEVQKAVGDYEGPRPVGSQLPKRAPLQIGGQRYNWPKPSIGKPIAVGQQQLIPVRTGAETQFIPYKEPPFNLKRILWEKYGIIGEPGKWTKIDKKGNIKPISPKKSTEIINDIKKRIIEKAPPEQQRQMLGYLTLEEQKQKAEAGRMTINLPQQTQQEVTKVKARDRGWVHSRKFRPDIIAMAERQDPAVAYSGNPELTYFNVANQEIKRIYPNALWDADEKRWYELTNKGKPKEIISWDYDLTPPLVIPSEMVNKGITKKDVLDTAEDEGMTPEQVIQEWLRRYREGR